MSLDSNGGDVDGLSDAGGSFTHFTLQWPESPLTLPVTLADLPLFPCEKQLALDTLVSKCWIR